MLREYERIQAAVPAMIQPMMKPYTDRVDEAMKPGLVALTWASMNVDTCMYCIVFVDPLVNFKENTKLFNTVFFFGV